MSYTLQFFSFRKALVAAATFAFVIGNGDFASAQPGATPPGSVAPYAVPPPPPPPPVAAQPAGPPPTYYPPNSYPPPNGYAPPTAFPPPLQLPLEPQRRVRSGFNFGLNLGLGDMQSNEGEFVCQGCVEDPITVAFGLHAGFMLNPQLSLQLEIWGQARALDSYGDNTLTQTLILGAMQYWLSDRFWIKAGVGGATLAVDNNGESEAIDDGSAAMFALGYELAHSESFGWDIQIKSGAGFYDSGEVIESTTLTTGITWY